MGLSYLRTFCDGLQGNEKVVIATIKLRNAEMYDSSTSANFLRRRDGSKLSDIMIPDRKEAAMHEMNVFSV